MPEAHLSLQQTFNTSSASRDYQQTVIDEER